MIFSVNVEEQYSLIFSPSPVTLQTNSHADLQGDSFFPWLAFYYLYLWNLMEFSFLLFALVIGSLSVLLPLLYLWRNLFDANGLILMYASLLFQTSLNIPHKLPAFPAP